MSTKTMTKMIAEYFKTQPVLKAWLFGSFARGEEKPDSDVDLLVMFDHSTPIGLFDLVEEGTLRFAAEMTAKKDMKIVYERAY